MQTTILGLLKKKYPEAVKKWDGWDYKILSPVSLDDLPTIQVYLRNKGKGGLQMQLGLDLAGAVD